MGILKEMDFVVELWKLGRYEADADTPRSRWQRNLSLLDILESTTELRDFHRAAELTQIAKGMSYSQIADYVEDNPITAGVITNLIMMTKADQKIEQSTKIAEAGGNGRALKFKSLQAATIELYKAGNWPSIPLAALEITPKIIALSKKGNGELVPTTTKPIQWIRAYVKSQKGSPS